MHILDRTHVWNTYKLLSAKSNKEVVSGMYGTHVWNTYKKAFEGHQIHARTVTSLWDVASAE
jgi:hypothetical protein